MRFALRVTNTILRPLSRSLRIPPQAITHGSPFAPTQIRHYKRRKSYPVMAAVEDISKRLQGLNVGGVKEHASVKGGEEWRREVGEGVFTKTVSGVWRSRGTTGRSGTRGADTGPRERERR